jgi:hypothetical protein
MFVINDLHMITQVDPGFLLTYLLVRPPKSTAESDLSVSAQDQLSLMDRTHMGSVDIIFIIFTNFHCHQWFFCNLPNHAINEMPDTSAFSCEPPRR